MNEAEIRKELAGHPWGAHLLVYDQVVSTNTLVKALGKEGAPEGTVMIAERQSGGRGRMGRSFLSPGGAGIYMSVLLRPNTSPAELMHLTCAAALAMCDAVEAAAGVRPQIKWINDLVIGRRKLGGILTELSVDPKTSAAEYAVIGVGINCCQLEDDFDPSIRDMATSLRIATGRKIDRNRLAAQMILAFHRLRLDLLTKKEEIMARYAQQCVTVGQDVQVIQNGQTRLGKAIGIDSDGALAVEYANGECAWVSCGEVSVRGMYGYI